MAISYQGAFEKMKEAGDLHIPDQERKNSIRGDLAKHERGTACFN